MAHRATYPKLNRGWGYQLDYDQEIANDLREIADAERHVPLAAVLTDAEREQGPWHVYLDQFLVADHARRAPLLGIAPEELGDLVEFLELELPGGPLPEPTKGWYSRGEATWQRIDAAFGRCVLRDPQPLLKKLRARLARHRRNKGLHG